MIQSIKFGILHSKSMSNLLKLLNRMKTKNKNLLIQKYTIKKLIFKVVIIIVVHNFLMKPFSFFL